MITPQHPDPRRRCSGRALTTLVSLTVALGGLITTWTTASAATITTAFDAGHPDVVINGYGTDGMGTFVLDDGETEYRALCVEADVSHSGALDAYSPADRTIDSRELDALLWWIDRQPVVTDDTAVAAAALAWYYADARRGGGLPVWADSGRSFAPISPTEPHRWDALPALSLSYPVGLTSSGTHLDAAERRVYELDALAARLASPWALTVDPSGRVEVRSDGGPLAEVDVAVTVERPGEVDIEARLRTDGDGRAAIDLPETPDGATIRAAVEMPGRHREWDGADVQRMSTATSEILMRTATVPPLPHHIEVHKRSSDPTIGVAGGEFELVDAAGTAVERVTVSPAGVARFGPIDRRVHALPYSVTEVVAPPGLIRAEAPILVADASTDPQRPTVLDVVNHPATVDVVVHKRLSIPGVGPPDRSGFEFVLTRSADGRTHRIATADDGLASPLPLAIGTYEVCETSVPDWAQGLVDGGCVELTVDVDTLGGPPAMVEYLNIVPTPTIDTRVEDPADGDRTARAGTGTIVDRVRLDGLVPGTAYTLVGQVVAGDDATVVEARPPSPSAPATARQAFVAAGASAQIDLGFDITGASSGEYVIIEWLLIGDQIVAIHHDLDDPDQTFRVVPPATTTSSTPATSTSTIATPTSSTPTSSTPATSTSTIATTTPVATTDPPVVATATTAPPATLPPTGSPEFLGRLLGWADAGFVVGVALVAVATSRRRDAHEAGR